MGEIQAPFYTIKINITFLIKVMPIVIIFTSDLTTIILLYH